MRRRSQTVSTRRRSSHRGREAVDDAAEGIELTFVCQGVPVLSMDKACIFHENASWMLQSALSSSGKADALFEYYDDREVLRECRRLGLAEDEVSIVRVRQSDLHHVRAVGTTGKRSVMMAAVVALGLEDGLSLGTLWRELQDYKLDRPFLALLNQCKHKARGRGREDDCRERELERRREREREEEEVHTALVSEGVDLKIVAKRVPVLGLSKESTLQEHASWLLQSGTGSSGRADSLYEYISDRELLSECRRIGLCEQEAGMARLRRKGMPSIEAVGTCGKRSIMLSLVVALVLREELDPRELLRQVGEYDGQLVRPVTALLRAALLEAGMPLGKLGGRSEATGSGSWSTRRGSRSRDWSQSRDSKRKWELDYDDGGSERSRRGQSQDWGRSWSQWRSNKKKRGNGRHTWPDGGLGSNTQSLDTQLAEYLFDDEDR